MRDEESREPPARVRWWMTEALLGVLCSGAFAMLTVYFGIKWLAFDEPYESYRCYDGVAVGPCSRGEEANKAGAIVSGVAGLVTVTYTSFDLIRHRRRHMRSSTLGVEGEPVDDGGDKAKSGDDGAPPTSK